MKELDGGKSVQSVKQVFCLEWGGQGERTDEANRDRASLWS